MSISNDDMNLYRDKFIEQLEDMNRNKFLGLKPVRFDNSSGKYMIIQLFELHNAIGIDLTSDNITILSDIILYKKICC